MPQQRQGAGAIIGQSQRHLCPANSRAPHAVGGIAGVNHSEAMCTGEPFDFLERHLVHVPLCFRWTMAERDRQQAPRLQKRDQLAEGTWPVSRRNMLPNAAQQDDICCKAKAQRCRERGQMIIHPADVMVWVKGLPTATHCGGGLDGYDLMPHSCKPCGVAASPSTHIED